MLLNIDPVVLIGTGSAVVGSLLTFLVSRKDAASRAHDTTITTLTTTIERLEVHIQHLDARLKELDKQLSEMADENVALSREIHALRMQLSSTPR